MWRARFAFFAQHGAPSSSIVAGQAWWALSWHGHRTLVSNYPAFFLGPAYFFAKGMWRKGATLLAAMLIGNLILTASTGDLIDVLLQVPNGLVVLGLLLLGGWIGPITMLTANYAFYLHVTAGSRSWNPFEGLFRRPARERQPAHHIAGIRGRAH